MASTDFPPAGAWNNSFIGDLRGKNALVTGSNSGLGFETTRKLAENGAKVFMVSRDLQNGLDAAAKIRAEFGKGTQLEVLECDFRELRNVMRLAAEFRERTDEPLHILIAMAGVFFPGPYAKTQDGIEQTLQINFYAHALLILCLLDRLRANPRSRLVVMASGFELLTGKLDWNNLRGEHYTNSGGVPYGTSKVMKIMFARELSARCPELDCFVVHPGLTMTPLYIKSKGLPEYPLCALIKLTAPFCAQSVKRGSQSTLYAATCPSLCGKRFGYFAPSLLFLNKSMTKERSPGNAAGRNRAACWKLFDEACRILQEVVGSAAFQIPSHPDDASDDAFRRK